MNAREKIRRIIRSIFTLFLIVSLSGLVSCEKNEQPVPPTPQPAKYAITGVVLNQESNNPIAGVTVKMGTLTQTTTANGKFEFKDLENPGKYTLVFTKTDFFGATFSLDIPAAAPNHVITIDISVTMVPYVAGVTPLNPTIGGTINISGASTTSLTIPAGTTVTDKDNKAVTGSINITAVNTPDILSGTLDNPGLAILRFEPSGLKFSKPLPLAVSNPLSSARFTNMELEFYNESTTQWELQTQPVTYDESGKKYNTTINHFSIYKLAFVTTKTNSGALEEALNVLGTPIEKNSLSFGDFKNYC